MYFYNEFIIVNKELFMDLIINRYNSKDLQTSEKEYIINSGKILIKIDKQHQLIIGNLSLDEFDFIPELLIVFEEKNYLYDNFKSLCNEKYDSYIERIKNKVYKIYNKDKCVGECFKIKNETNKNNNIKDNEKEKEKNKIIESLILLYYNFERFNNQIKNTTIKANINNKYYLINRKWRNIINEYYKFDKLCNYLIKNKLADKDKLSKKIINDLIIQMIDKRIIDELILKNEDFEISNISKIETLDKINENKNVINFYNKCVIINEEIKNIFEKYFKIRIEKSVDCSINLNKIIMLYELNGSYLINIGKLNDKNTYESNLLIKMMNEEEYQIIYESIIINNKIPEILNETKLEKDIIKDGKIIGTVYKINNINENKTKNDLKNNGNNNQNENGKKHNNNNNKEIAIIDNSEKNNKKPKEEEKKEKEKNNELIFLLTNQI
jgi:hypothetical protein